MTRILRHLTAWLRRGRLDAELRDELAQHVAWKAEGLMAEGVPEIEARRRAALEVGNLTRLREESRAIWGFPSIDSLVQDARYGWRQLRRTPVFTLATVTTLTLTIGATSALFAIANAVLLRPLPYPRSDRIVSISIVQQGTDTRLMDEPTARLALESALPSFESLALYNTTGANFSGAGQPERVAFALAICGLYAVTAYLVAQRTREFGLRIALGADRATVLRLVLRQGLAPAASGLLLGLLASVALTRLLRTRLYEVDVLDAGVFAGVTVTLALVSVLAAAVPARRAMRVDPAVALRCE